MNGQWSCAFICHGYYGMFVMNYRKGKKKEVILVYKGYSHDQIYCVTIQICHCLCTYGTIKVKQETLAMTIII